MSEFMSYDEALGELSLSKEELNDIIAKGELRAFREGDDVRFKSEDIIGLKKSRETEPTIVLSDTEADRASSGLDEAPIDLDAISTDETVLNIEGLLEDETEGTTPIPGAGALEDEIEIGSIGEDTVLDTDGIDLDDDFEFAEDETLIDSEEETLLAGASQRSVQMVRRESHAGWTAVTAFTLLLMLGPVVVLMNLMMTSSGTYPKWVDEAHLTALNGLVEGILNLF